MSPLLSFRNGVIAFCLVLIVAFAGGTYLYQHGKHVGQLHQQTVTDTKAYHAAQHDAEEADVKVDALKGRADLATKHVAQAREKVRRALAPLALTPTTAMVNGDSTPSVVIPALVRTIRAYQQLDSAQSAKDTVQTYQVALADTALAKHRVVDASAVRVIEDYREANAPKCGAKCGAVITAAAILGGALLAHHFGLHF